MFESVFAKGMQQSLSLPVFYQAKSEGKPVEDQRLLTRDCYVYSVGVAELRQLQGQKDQKKTIVE